MFSAYTFLHIPIINYAYTFLLFQECTPLNFKKEVYHMLIYYYGWMDQTICKMQQTLIKSYLHDYLTQICKRNCLKLLKDT